MTLTAAGEDGPVFMWKATRDGAVMHLLGSVHAGRNSWYPLDERVAGALAAADTVACELDIGDPAVAMKVAMLAQQEGMYPEGESLRDHVGDETWAELVRRLAGAVPQPMLERMRPGLAAATLAQATLARAGLDLTAGVDMHVLNAARQAEQPIVSLETAEEQVAVLLGEGGAIDALLLEESLQDTADDMLAMLDEILGAWHEGDPRGMEEIYREDWLDDATMQRFHEALLTRRNERMAANLARRQGCWFVVVGALHLCGADGLPVLLAEAGWDVEQVGAAVAPGRR